MTAVNLENDIGQPYLNVSCGIVYMSSSYELQTNDFLRNGIPSSVLATAVIITLYVLI
jgi:hypothetical protein